MPAGRSQLGRFLQQNVLGHTMRWAPRLGGLVRPLGDDVVTVIAQAPDRAWRVNNIQIVGGLDAGHWASSQRYQQAAVLFVG